MERGTTRRPPQKPASGHDVESASIAHDRVDFRDGLLSLPAEIWVEVFDYMNVAELKTIRLVNRSFAELGAPLLFRRCYLYITEESYRRLESLASHPVLSKYVRSISYDTRSLPDDRTVFSWKLAVKSKDESAWGF